MYTYRNIYIYIYIHEYSRRTGAAAGELRTAPSPPFWLRRVGETEAGSTCVDARRRGGGVRASHSPPLLYVCVSECIHIYMCA